MDIIFKEVNHLYQAGTPFERYALMDVNLNIPSGRFLAIIGHTGSGKSTLIQHINGLLKPTSGSVGIGSYEINPKQKKNNMKDLRKRVGLVFQYPEHQLFEETVEKDICFGPMNFGMSESEARSKAREMIKLVGLPEKYLDYSPFDLSGGQMRRVAIAGVLAMNPDVLILDEPTAGLDPRGRTEIMNMFQALHREKQLTTILVTHSMEDAALFADEIIVMQKGKVFLKGTPDEIFSQPDKIKNAGLDVPETVKFATMLEEKFEVKLPKSYKSLDSLADHIVQFFYTGEGKG